MKTKVLLSFLTLFAYVSFNSIAQDNVYFSSEAFSAGIKPTNQIALKPKEENGKKVLNVQPAKGPMKAFSFGAFEEEAEMSKKLGKATYKPKASFNYAEGKSIGGSARMLEIENGVYVVYEGNKKGDFYTEPKMILAFAKDEATAKEWAGDKGLKAVTDIEGNSAKNAQNAEAEEELKKYANSTMPNPGKLHTPENVQKAKEAIQARVGPDGSTVLKVVILDDDWTISRNKNTGIVTRRFFNVLYAETHKSRDPRIAWKFMASIVQEHDGSNFSGPWKCPGVAQTLKYGPIVIPVENLK